MISVYRVYVGRSWSLAHREAQLLRLFDALPEFLHAPCSLAELGAEIDHADDVARRACAKIAMTHCHVALLWGGMNDPALDWTRHEMQVARSGFRRRIPIVAVVPEGGGGRSASASRAADRTVPFKGAEIALAVTELAEAAASLRRTETDRLAAMVIPPEVPAVRPLPEPTEPRPLPTADIAAAYDSLKAFRKRRS